MNEREYHERLQELGHSWQAGIVALDDAKDAEVRGSKMVNSIGDAIVRAAEGRRRARSIRRAASVLAVAAGLGGAAFLASRLLTKNPEISATTSAALDGAALGGAEAVTGQLTLLRDSKESIVERTTLKLGDELSMAPGGRATLHLGNIVRADLSDDGRLSVLPEGVAAHRLRLDHGRIEAHVDDHPSARPKLVVETPDVEVIVTGTIFDVAVSDDAAHHPLTHVGVTKGRVVIRRAGKDVAVVTAGQAWPEAIADVAVPVPAPVEAPAPARTVRHSHKAAVAAPVVRGPSEGELADVRVGTLGEENALFQAAVDGRNRGDDATVVDRLGQLLNRHPSSPLAGEARVERMRAYARSGKTEAATREARRYLAEYPDGFARDEAKRLVMRDGASPR
jgi:hypothetical protein